MSKILKVVNRLIVQPCMDEEESYAIRSRKLCSIAVCVIASNALLLGVPVTIIADIFDPTLGVYIVGSTLFLVSITSSLLPYGYLRYTKTLPDWLVEIQIWAALLCTLSLSLFVHQGSVAIVGSCVALMGLILRVKLWPLVIFCGLSFNVIHALINDYGDVLPALHETFYSNQLLSVRIMYLLGSNITPFVLFGIGLHVIMMEFVQRSEQADAAIAMNLAVADKLRRYDTDGVAEILAANKGKVDENLLEAFTAIQHNLQEYRPHIPDYVIASSQSELTTYGNVTDDDEEDDDVIDEDDEGCLKISNSVDNNTDDICSIASSDAGHTVCKEIRNTGDHSNRRSVEVAAASSVVGHRLSHSQGPLFMAPSTRSCDGRDSIDSDMNDDSARLEGSERNYAASSLTSSLRSSTNEFHVVSGGRGNRSAKIELPPKRSDRISPASKTSAAGQTNSKARQHFYGRATTVFVRFVSASCGSDGSGNGFVSKSSVVSAMNILSKCVDAGSKLAKAQGGALQYMQGCGLMVSFNAASRAHAHESKACAFALGLKAAVDDMLDATIVMHASIVTTNVLSFFAGNSGQLMLIVLGAFMPQHTAMHHYLSQTVGKEASCVLLSDTVVPTIEMLYEHRLLGAVLMKAHPAKAGVFKHNDSVVLSMSQLRHSRSTLDEEEWMYHASKKLKDIPDHLRELSEIIRYIVQFCGKALDGREDDAITTSRTELIQRGTIQALLPQCDANDTVLEKCVKERLLAFTTTTTTNAEDGGGFIVNAAPIVIW